jgi:hypothetical protein
MANNEVIELESEESMLAFTNAKRREICESR